MSGDSLIEYCCCCLRSAVDFAVVVVAEGFADLVCRQAVAAGTGVIRGFVQVIRYLSIATTTADAAAAGEGNNTGGRFAA